jgi:hypothetical protein
MKKETTQEQPEQRPATILERKAYLYDISKEIQRLQSIAAQIDQGIAQEEAQLREQQKQTEPQN